MKRILELRQNRAKLIADARVLLDKAEKEKRAMSAEETGQYEKIMADVDGIKVDIDRQERQIALEKDLEGSNGVNRPDPAQQPPDGSRAEQPTASQEYRAAFRSYLAGGEQVLTEPERRALQAGNDTLGGYIKTPAEFVADLLKGVDNEVYVRKYATIIRLAKADTVGRPVLTTDVSDPIWTTELNTGDEDSSMAFGKRELSAHPLAKRIKVSRKLLRVGAIDPEALVRERLQYKFSVVLENNYLNGDGSQKPLGMFVASADGISTGRDVVTGSNTDFTADGLIDGKAALKTKYWKTARWLLSRTGFAKIRKLKTSGSGEYVWRAGIAGFAEDMILDCPYDISEYVPSTFTVNQYVAVLGDLRFYHILDSLDLEIQRLVELYAATNQVGYIGRYEGDGMPVLEEAFVRMKCGT